MRASWTTAPAATPATTRTPASSMADRHLFPEGQLETAAARDRAFGRTTRRLRAV